MLNGEKGDTYEMTTEDLEAVADELAENANSTFNTNVTEKTEAFNANVETKTTEFNENVETQTTNATEAISTAKDNAITAIDDEATTKISEYDENVESQTTAFNANVTNQITNATDEIETAKTNAIAEFDENATTQTDTYNDNVTAKIAEYNENASDLINSREGKHSYYRYEITEDIEADSEIDIGAEYIVDSGNLVVLFCGERLIKDTHYAEVGDVGTSSTIIQILTDYEYLEDYDKYFDFIVKEVWSNE